VASFTGLLALVITLVTLARLRIMLGIVASVGRERAGDVNALLQLILRDIMENETVDIVSTTSTEEEFCRALNDKAARCLELVAEIEDFLRREDAAKRVSA